MVKGTLQSMAAELSVVSGWRCVACNGFIRVGKKGLVHTVDGSLSTPCAHGHLTSRCVCALPQLVKPG